MGLCLFDELDHENAAYCHALGLDASPYEAKLSPAEAAIARLNSMPPVGMSGHTASRPAPAPHCVVEIARPDWQEALADSSIQRFFADSRRKGAPAFVGD